MLVKSYSGVFSKIETAVAERDTKPYRLTEKEINLVELCRNTGYGQFVVYLENSQPVRVESLKKSIKL